MKTYSYRTIIEPDEHGTFHGFVPSLPGCHTWGESLEEVKANLRDAMDAYIRSLLADGEAVPTDETMEIIESISLDPTLAFV